MKRLLSYNPLTGISTYHEYDSVNKQNILTEVQDVRSIIESNKLKQNDTDYSKKGIKNDWWEYAQIPVIIQSKWLHEDGINIHNKNHKKAVYKKLNDPEYRWLKTTTGRHA